MKIPERATFIKPLVCNLGSVAKMLHVPNFIVGCIHKGKILNMKAPEDLELQTYYRL